MEITKKTRSIELFRIMWQYRGMDVVERPAIADEAHAEWDRRCELAGKEYGAGAGHAKGLRWDAYYDGRADELKERGEDLRFAKVLLETLATAGIAAPRELSASDLIRLRARE